MASGMSQFVKKASQSLLPAGGKSIEIIFVRGVYLDENSSQITPRPVAMVCSMVARQITVVDLRTSSRMAAAPS